MKDTPYIYCICRIDRKTWKYINEDLSSRGYKRIKAYIPTVQILKKTKEGKNYYDEVPLLFNYGFIKMKSEKAFDRNFLNKLKKNIPGILNWMKSPENLFPKKKRARIDNAEDFDDFSIVATISRKQIRYYKQISKRNNIFSLESITSLKIGDYITLRGYPFEGIGAVVDEISLVTKTVTVTIYSGKGSINIQLPMDNVLYSVYNNYDEDNLESPETEIDISQIPDGSTEELLNSKQY